jgi:hypothetical protein
MNLIRERWFPVADKNGVTRKTAPWEIGVLSKPGTYLNFARPDFNLSVTLLLIGFAQLLRRAFPEWSLNNPPSEEEMKKVLMQFQDAFNLFGDGPLFMQDKCPEKESIPIFSLLLDGSRIQTVKQKRDFFRKDGTVKALCPSCGAAALHTLQTFSFKGGGGHYTSPLNNLLLLLKEGNSVWETVWKNTLPPKDFAEYGNGSIPTPMTLFPWLTISKEPRTLKKALYPAEHIYFLEPLRILLSKEDREGTCGCCGETSPTIITKFYRAPKGIQYGSQDYEENKKVMSIGKDIDAKLKYESSKALRDRLIKGEKVPPLIEADYSVLHPLMILELSKKKKIENEEDDIEEGAPNIKKARVSKFRLRHSYISEVLYELDDYKISPLPDACTIKLCGTLYENNYDSWYEKSIPFRKDRKDLIGKLLAFQSDAIKATEKSTIYSTNKYVASRKTEEALESLFYSLVRDNPADALEQWYKAVVQLCLQHYELYANRKYWMRNQLVEALNNLLKKVGVEVQIPMSSISRKQTYLPKETCKIIMAWWRWITVHKKAVKYTLMRISKYEDLMEKNEYSLNLYKKVHQSLFPGEVEAPENFGDRLAMATYLALQLRDINNVPFSAAIKELAIGDPADSMKDMVAVVREKKQLDILSIYNFFLYRR